MTTPSLDGTPVANVQGSPSATFTVTVTTTVSDTVVIFILATTKSGITAPSVLPLPGGVTSTLTLVKYEGPDAVYGADNNMGGGQGAAGTTWFWCHAATVQTGTTVTFHLDDTPDHAICNVYAVKDCANPASPWDTDSSFVNAGAFGGPTSGWNDPPTWRTNFPFDTTDSPDMILLHALDAGEPGGASTPAGWTSIVSGSATGANAPNITLTSYFMNATTPQSGLVATDGYSPAGNGIIVWGASALVGSPGIPAPIGTINQGSLRRTQLPLPPDPASTKYRGNVLQWQKDAYEWMRIVKGRLETDSAVNTRPIGPLVLGTYTAVNTITGTDDVSNFLATLISLLQGKGYTVPFNLRTTS